MPLPLPLVLGSSMYISEVWLESSSGTIGFSEPCPCCGNTKRYCLHLPPLSKEASRLRAHLHPLLLPLPHQPCPPLLQVVPRPAPPPSPPPPPEQRIDSLILPRHELIHLLPLPDPPPAGSPSPTPPTSKALRRQKALRHRQREGSVLHGYYNIHAGPSPHPLLAASISPNLHASTPLSDLRRNSPTGSPLSDLRRNPSSTGSSCLCRIFMPPTPSLLVEARPSLLVPAERTPSSLPSTATIPPAASGTPPQHPPLSRVPQPSPPRSIWYPLQPRPAHVLNQLASTTYRRI